MSHPIDPQQPTHDHDHDPLDPTDARIDALARAAGGELRRPAPPDGIARARRTRRNRLVMRTALSGTAAIAFVAVGVVALRSGDDSVTVVPVDAVSTTDVSVPAPEPTAGPTTVPASQPTVGAPSTIYTVTGDPTDPSGTQTLLDPLTGEVVGSSPIDVELAQAAQADLPGGVRSTVDLGDVAYDFRQVVYDGGTLDTDVFTDVDLCGQNVVTVRSAAGSALPERAHVLSVSPDDRYVVTLSSVCPEAGTMGADGTGTSIPFEATLQVFDARHPELAGQTLLTGIDALNVGVTTFSADGRFVAMETFSDQQYRVFDLESGDELDLAGGCSVSGPVYSRFIGPWIGASSIAVVRACADGRQLLVRDLATGDELVVPAPSATTGDGDLRAEVDHAHFDTPSNAWFLLCSTAQQTCWVGHGDDGLVELAEVTDASFLPLGFYPGG